jgi:hypothetical protein
MEIFRSITWKLWGATKYKSRGKINLHIVAVDVKGFDKLKF